MCIIQMCIVKRMDQTRLCAVQQLQVHRETSFHSHKCVCLCVCVYIDRDNRCSSRVSLSASVDSVCAVTGLNEGLVPSVISS